MRKLLLLRHGMTEANEKGVFSGAIDLPLSERGRAALAPLRGRMPPASLFFTSGMLRARQTLEILYGHVDSVTVEELAEYRFGTFEMRSHADLFEKEPVYRLWLQEDALDIACPGGETRRAFEARVRSGFFRVVSYSWEGLAVLVAHGGVIRQILLPFVSLPLLSNGEGALLTVGQKGEILAVERFRPPGKECFSGETTRNKT